MTDTERVEFHDAPVSGAGGEDLVESGDHGRPPRRSAVLLAGLVVLALVAAGLVAKLAGDGPTPRAGVTASPSPIGRRPATPVTTPVFGLVGLPRAIGEPREMVAAQSGDVVWMLDQGGGIVRLDGGVRTAVQLLEHQATAIAVSPSGDRLYVATAGAQPSIQVLNATTLGLGRSQPLTGSVQALTVSIDAVWAAVGDNLLRLDVDSLQTLGTVVMPGVVLTSHLRVQIEQSQSNQQYIVGLTTSPNDDGSTTSRFVRVDPLTQEVLFGPPIPGVGDVATGQFLTWVTTTRSPGAASTVEGLDSVLDDHVSAVAPDLPAGTRIYDGGGGYAAFLSVTPHSSVVDCHDGGGFATSEFDVRPAVADAVVTGQVLRTDTAFYVVTDRGLVRAGVGGCG